MADQSFDPGFEQRLERQLLGFADDGLRPFDALEITRAAAAGSRRGMLPFGFPTWWRSGLVLALLTAALVGAGIAGGLIRLPTIDLQPNPTFQPFSPPPDASASPTTLETLGPGATPGSSTVPVATDPVVGPGPTTGATGVPTISPSDSPLPPSPSPIPVESASPLPSDTALPTESPPATESPLPTVEPLGTRAIATGDGHACAVAVDGRIFCWGANDEGQLGDGTRDYRDLATVAVIGVDDAVAISAGIRYSCAIRAGGTVWCWGEDPGSDATLSVPVPVPSIDDAVEITAGGAFACARRVGGSVACWGLGSLGQLGNGVFENNSGVPDPQPVIGIDNAVQISSGWNHTCALLGDRTVRCWGGNGDGATGYGQLGDGTLNNSATPVEVVGLDDVVEVRAGGWSTCAIRGNGSVWCWGYGEGGTLGDGTAANSSVPVQVATIANAERLAVGRFHACAALSDTSIWCWGDVSWGGGGQQNLPVEGTRLQPASSLATDRFLLVLDPGGAVWSWGFGSVNVPEPWPIGP